MNKIERAKKEILSVIAGSEVEEDLRHAQNTLEWLLKIKPDADHALQISALGHDIERAITERKVRRSDFDDYDEFKKVHAKNSSKILREILNRSQISENIIDETCRLVTVHEVGGEIRSNLLKDVDSISYFDVNLPLYFEREGWEESKRRCVWGYQRLSKKMRSLVLKITYENPLLGRLVRESVQEAEGNQIHHSIAKSVSSVDSKPVTYGH